MSENTTYTLTDEQVAGLAEFADRIVGYSADAGYAPIFEKVVEHHSVRSGAWVWGEPGQEYVERVAAFCVAAQMSGHAESAYNPGDEVEAYAADYGNGTL